MEFINRAKAWFQSLIERYQPQEEEMGEVADRIQAKLAEVGAKLADLADDVLTAIDAKVDELKALVDQAAAEGTETPEAPPEQQTQAAPGQPDPAP